jgi:PhzF family phenazine biosynthesis protein
MKIKMYQADAFTDKLFRGNPAAICMLEYWLPETIMQAIAAENNLAETAFIVTSEIGYEIRWFTPTVEVDLCGHATLAAAHIIFQHYNTSASELVFHSHRSGTLKVSKSDGMLALDFPVDTYSKIPTPPELIKGLGIEPMETIKGKTDYMAVLPTEDDVKKVRPDFSMLNSLDCRGIIVTAAGKESDFVSRFFAPQSGINEDPVTGSAHTTLAPYWAAELGRDTLSAIQLSDRRGYLWCKMQGSRVAISGNAVTYLQGEIEVAR